MTEDGTTGYCFDKNLRIFDIKDSGALSSNVIDLELLHQFLDKPFRPEYFRDMIRDDMLDLSRFKTTRGIFAYPDENKVILSTKDHQITFDYTGIVQNSSGRFIFEGSSLQIEVRSDNRIAAYYSYNNTQYAEVMVYIENMEELIEAELERRNLLLEEIASLGTVSSTAYGRITFSDTARFGWSNYNRLTPNVIPESAGEFGSLRLDYFPGKRTPLKLQRSSVFRFR